MRNLRRERKCTMKYIGITILALLLAMGTLTSCGGQDASTNNGSDTGVSGTVDRDIMDDIERGIDDVTDGTVFDADGEHSNVDEYYENGNYSGSTSNYSGDTSTYNTPALGDNGTLNY